MRRDLDEIEMEMGKERTMKGCTYTGNRCYKHPRYYASDCVDCPYFKECIPVEPERVQGRWYCANPEGCYSTDGIPDVHPATCAGGCEWLRRRSPGLLQRMGMATWPSEAKEWFVIYQDGEGFHQCNFIDGDRTGLSQGEALELARRQSNRWQDGLR